GGGSPRARGRMPDGGLGRPRPFARDRGDDRRGPCPAPLISSLEGISAGGDSMRILVMGTGGLGGYFGGLLQRAGEDVVFVARGAHLRALQESGLKVTSPDGDFALPVRAADRAADAPVDLVLFAVKTYDFATAAEAIRPAVGPETAILCLQNGVETEDRLGEMYGHEHILGGVTYVSAVIEAPGVIAHT